MGYSFKGICHTNIEAAQSAFLQSLTMSTLTTDGQLITSSCDGIQGYFASCSIWRNSVESQTQAVVPTFQICNHDGGVNLSLEYFVLAVGFLSIIAASKAVLNIFRGRTDVA